MPVDEEKEKLLNRAGYVYHFKRDIYFNRQSRKIFSRSVVEDNDEHWLQGRIDAPNVGNDWQFYFGAPERVNDFETPASCI